MTGGTEMLTAFPVETRRSRVRRFDLGAASATMLHGRLTPPLPLLQALVRAGVADRPFQVL